MQVEVQQLSNTADSGLDPQLPGSTSLAQSKANLADTLLALESPQPAYGPPLGDTGNISDQAESAAIAAHSASSDPAGTGSGATDAGQAQGTRTSSDPQQAASDTAQNPVVADNTVSTCVTVCPNSVGISKGNPANYTVGGHLDSGNHRWIGTFEDYGFACRTTCELTDHLTVLLSISGVRTHCSCV